MYQPCMGGYQSHYKAPKLIIWIVCLVECLRDGKHLYRNHVDPASPRMPASPPSLSSEESLCDLFLRVTYNVRQTCPKQSSPQAIRPLTTSSCRVTIAAICKLVYLGKTLKVPDPVLHTWPIAVCTQIIQCLSIISACFPCLQPRCSEIVGSIESGFMRRKTSSQSDMKDFDFSRAMGLRDLTKGRHAASAVAEVEAQDASSRGQRYMTQAYMIRETKTFAVEQEALACRYC